MVASGQATISSWSAFQGSVTFSSPKFPFLNFMTNFAVDLEPLFGGQTGPDRTLLKIQLSPNSVHQFSSMSAIVRIQGPWSPQTDTPMRLAFKVDLPNDLGIEGTVSIASFSEWTKNSLALDGKTNSGVHKLALKWDFTECPNLSASVTYAGPDSENHFSLDANVAHKPFDEPRLDVSLQVRSNMAEVSLMTHLIKYQKLIVNTLLLSTNLYGSLCFELCQHLASNPLDQT